MVSPSSHFLADSAPERLLADVRPDRCAPKIREASLLTPCRLCMAQPTITHTPPEIPKPVILQMRWANAWWTASGQHLLPAGPLVLALRRHLSDLPVLQADQCCTYAPFTTGRVCSQQVNIPPTFIPAPGTQGSSEPEQKHANNNKNIVGPWGLRVCNVRGWSPHLFFM